KEYSAQGAWNGEASREGKMHVVWGGDHRRVRRDKVLTFAVKTVGGATAGVIAPVLSNFCAVHEVWGLLGVLLVLDEVNAHLRVVAPITKGSGFFQHGPTCLGPVHTN